MEFVKDFLSWFAIIIGCLAWVTMCLGVIYALLEFTPQYIGIPGTVVVLAVFLALFFTIIEEIG